jgi:hypothetical protein
MANLLVQTPDGIIHELPDSVTLDNYEIEKEKFLANYNIPQEDFTSIPQPQSQPQPKTSTDDYSHTQKVIQSLFGSVKDFDFKTYSEENKDKSSAYKQIQGSFSKEFVELPNRNYLYNLVAKRKLLENERTEILSKNILTKEDTNRLLEIDKLINDGEMPGATVKEAEDRAFLDTIEYMASLPLGERGGGPSFSADLAAIKYAELKKDENLGINDTIKYTKDNVDRSVDFQSGIKYSKSFQDLAAATSFDESMDIFLSDPFNLMGQVLASSSAPMSKSLAAGVGATLLTGNPYVGALATGVTSGSVDAAYSFTEYMVKTGVNIDDEEEVAIFMTDPEKVAAAKRYARIRATSIGAFDTLSFGFGSKLIAPTGISTLRNKALFNSLIVQPPLQGALGGAGEYFAQLGTLEEGEAIRVGEVFMEAIGEIAFAPVEATLAQASTRFSDYKNIQREASQKQQERFNNFETSYANLTTAQKESIDTKGAEVFERIQNNNPDKSTEEILDLTYQELQTTFEAFEAQKIIQENPLENLAYNQFKDRNETTVKQNQNGTFDVITIDTNQPNNFKVLRTFDDFEKAGKVASELNEQINTYVNRQTFQEDAVMQNLDIANPFIKSFANNSLNTVLDGITFGAIEDAGVSPETIALLKDIAQSNSISPEVLKANLSKKEFDAVMRINADRLNAKPKKSISSTAFNTLLNNKNIESNINLDSFKRFALQFTGEQDVNKMSIAQKRVLFTLLENLPTSPDKINLPDFTPRSFDVSDYNKAKAEIEKQGKATLKIIQDATGLNKVSAKRIMEYFVIAGYVNKKGNKFNFVGTENQIYNIDGTRRLTSDIEINKDIENVKQTLVNDTTITPNVRSKIATFLDELTDPNIIETAGGSYNPVFNEILYTIDRADLNLLDKNSIDYNPKEFLNIYARLQGHENFHALIQAGLFTQQEINALTNTATNKKISSKLEKALQNKLDKDKPANEKIKYSDKTYLKFATEQYTGQVGYENPAAILEEGMALVFEDYITTNAKITGRPRTALQKVSNFGKAVGNALANNGFFTVEDIVDKTLQGKIADRNRGVSNRIENTTRLFNTPEQQDVIVADEPSVKFSLRETNARLTDSTKERLEQQSGAPTLEGHFRELYKTTASIPPPIKEFIRDARSEGSEYIAPLLDMGPTAFVQSRVGNRKDQGTFYYPFQYPKNLTVNQAQQIFDGINRVTKESITLFPDEVVVYRGSSIDDSFNLIPVTTNKYIAEMFGKNINRREENIEAFYYQEELNKQGISLKEFAQNIQNLTANPRDVAKYGYDVKRFILPKETIVANIEALYAGESRLGGMYADRHNYKGEQEFLVPRELLINDNGDTTGRQVLTNHLAEYTRVKQDRMRIAKEFETLTSGRLETDAVNKDYITTLTSKQVIEERKNLIRLAKSPVYQKQKIAYEDLYSLVAHPAMIATQIEALNIPDVYENLTNAQITQRINDMRPELINIAAKHAGGGENVKADRKAVIIIGPPATGKSTFAEDIAERKGYAIVDADDAKKIMPEFNNGIGANATHPFSKVVSSEIAEELIDQGFNIILPKVTGKSDFRQQPDQAKLNDLIFSIEDLQSKGYKVDVVYPDANINQALVRAVTRFGETGRFVNLDYLLTIDNKVRDTYNALKEHFNADTTDDVGFTYINNNFKLGEHIVEEDTAQLFQDDRIVDRDRSRSRKYSQRKIQEITQEESTLIRIAEEQKQNSIAAGVTPVINTNADPKAVASAVKAQQEIKNSASENNADVDSIISNIPNDVKLKYSFNKNNNPLNKNAEELIENLTVRNDTIENKTTGQLILEGFKSVDPLASREALIDQYARLAETDYKAGRKNKYGDKTLLASMSAGAALYFSDRSGDIFQQSFLRGVPVYDKNKGYTYVTDVSPIDNQPIVPYFEVFKPAFKNPNLLWAFQAVQRVKRETRFNKEGRKVKVTAADRKRAKQALKDYPELQTMIDSYNRTNEHTVQFLVDTGVLDEKTGKEWLANSDYIPFYRPLEGMEGFKGPKIFQGLSITPFQRAKGSKEKDIVDPITGITNNLRAAINVGMKNIAANRVMRNMIDMGVAQKVKGNVKGPDIVTIRVNGKNINFKVDDPLLFNSFVMMNKSDNFMPQSLFMNILRLGKRAVSDLITRVPDFWFRQIVRDSASASVLSGANYIPVFSSIKESFSIAKGMITGKLPDEFVKLRNAGVITGYDKGVRDVDTTEKLINNLYKNSFKKERPTAQKVLMFPLDLITTIWDIMGQGTAITDAATRVAVYKDTLKRTGNEAEAVFQALEVLNFTRRGNNEFFQLYAQSTMFLNPRLQGLDVFYRGLTGRYGIGRGLSRSKRLKSVLMRVAAMSSLSVYYYLLARDSEEYEEAPEQIKDNYLIIPGSKKLTGQVVAIPKPFEVGLLTMTVPERLTAYFMDDIAGQDVASSLRRNIGHTLAVGVPTAVDPIVENYFNYDFFTKRQIVPDYLEGTGDLAYRPTTDTLSKKIGDELNMSPLYIENLFRSYSGTLGSWIMMLTDSLIREGLTDAERVKYGLDKLPVVGTFLLPAEGSNYENQFYSLKGDVDDLIKTLRLVETNVVDKGDGYALGMTDEYQVGYIDGLKNLQSILTDTADTLKEIRNREAQIVNDTDMSSAEKKAELDELRVIKNEMLYGIPELRKEYIQEIKPEAVQR